MCRVKYCTENHKNHYCRVCGNNDSNHRSAQCPKGTRIFHGTKAAFADLIQQNGFKSSDTGRIGSGVYFTEYMHEAINIAKHKFGASSPVVIECVAEVLYSKFNRDDSVDVMMQKIQQWDKFLENNAKHSIHPPWANNPDFKEILIKNPKRIKIVKVHKV